MIQATDFAQHLTMQAGLAPENSSKLWEEWTDLILQQISAGNGVTIHRLIHWKVALHTEHIAQCPDGVRYLIPPRLELQANSASTHIEEDIEERWLIHCSFGITTAHKFYNTFVQQILALLQKGETLHWSRLGIFRMLSEGQATLEFTPEETFLSLINKPFEAFIPQVIPLGKTFSGLEEQAISSFEEMQASWRAPILIPFDDGEGFSAEDSSTFEEPMVLDEPIAPSEILVEENNAVAEEKEEKPLPPPLPEASLKTQGTPLPPPLEEILPPPLQKPADIIPPHIEKEKKKTSRLKWLWLLLLLLLLAVVIGLLLRPNTEVKVHRKKPEPSYTLPDSTVEKPLQDTLVQEASQDLLTPLQQETIPAPTEQKRVQKSATDLTYATLSSGEGLMDLALRYYGNKKFWVYIYLYNMDRIEDPNHISTTTELVIPSADIFNIDKDNPASLLAADSLKRALQLTY